MKYLLLFLLFSSALHAGTKFLWVLQKPNKIETGVCLEVDEKVDVKNFYSGEQFDFAKKVSVEKCKPKDKDISYFFNPNTGRCFEGDNATSGAKYFYYVKVKKCKTQKTEFKNMSLRGKYGCYEIDTKTQGIDYHKKMKPRFCLDDETLYTWVRTDQKTGKCYSFNSETGQKLQTKKSFCRPEKVEYNFIRTSSFSGYCLEYSTNPTNQYSQTVKVKFCKPKDTSFYFYKKPNELNGRCYEVDTETKGDLYLKSVKATKCK